MLVDRSAPMTADMTILGAPQLTFYVSIKHEDADFVVYLDYLYPNGDCARPPAGTAARLDARDRSHAQSSGRDPAPVQQAGDPLVPGKIYEIKMSLPPIGAVTVEGIASRSPSWRRLRSHSRTGDSSPPVSRDGTQSITWSTQPSVLNLPVLPGAKAQGPAPTCGSLDFQPCRPANTTDQLMFIVKPKIVP